MSHFPLILVLFEFIQHFCYMIMCHIIRRLSYHLFTHACFSVTHIFCHLFSTNISKIIQGSWIQHKLYIHKIIAIIFSLFKIDLLTFSIYFMQLWTERERFSSQCSKRLHPNRVYFRHGIKLSLNKKKSIKPITDCRIGELSSKFFIVLVYGSNL